MLIVVGLVQSKLYSATGFVWDILENSSDRDGRTPGHIKCPNLIVYCYKIAGFDFGLKSF